jgi:hypothetical protein
MARILWLCACVLYLLGSAVSFKSTASPALSWRRARVQSNVVHGARTVMGASRRVLDPMILIQDENMKQCPLRPFKAKETNSGLCTATFAMG